MIWDCVTVSTRGDCLRARNLARKAAAERAFPPELTADLDLVIAEIGSNLVKHAGGGRILLRSRDEAVDILSLDTGPGMARPAACMHDHFSTTGTLGGGLGAIRRKSAAFDLYTRPGSGVVLFACIGSAAPPPRPWYRRDALHADAVLVRKPGETECGDAWGIHRTAHVVTCLVADGLGHGEGASRAARRACGEFNEQADASLPDILQSIHRALRAERGAAGAIARILLEKNTLEYAGVGNIAGRIVDSNDGGMQGLPSIQGTLGLAIRRIQTFSFPWTRHSVLVMHSDGVSTRWKPADFPGLFTHSPLVIAGVILNRFWRERDDAVVLVAKNAPTATARAHDGA